MHDKRWYDIDPMVSSAMAMYKDTTDEKKVQIANYIIIRVKDFGITTPENELNDKFNYVLRRWYDQDTLIADSFKYLKAAPAELRQDIAMNVINMINAK